MPFTLLLIQTLSLSGRPGFCIQLGACCAAQSPRKLLGCVTLSLHLFLARQGFSSIAPFKPELQCAGAAAQGASSELGTAQNPLVMMQAEQSMASQLWRTMRTLGVAFLIISGVGVLMEDKGLGRGILNNPDMKPQMDMKTTLADVKGVDEAKVR